jgi:hypothetical protein
MAVPEQKTWGYFATLFSVISGAPAHFAFNMDEMYHQGWADAQEMVCLVPAAFEEPFVHSPVRRTGKRIPLIACIATDRSFVHSRLVIARKTFDDELLVHSFAPKKSKFTPRRSYASILTF